ncbi:lipopolysaccharide biosynthesis protein [uncultured Desulfobacter sp.]|uniref:lipopolysaccharide biosynthesis protein n=1 Tax=uncultured Desulfobacter sp. TaxID=240139 RepID=UPI0029C83882|nr:lipopolysaccharide biosynthesis protein [uncultured Desulfobacter sp.]
MTTLEQKTVKGIAWNLFERFGAQGLQFVLGILLARLLTPADFGLTGMIYVFFAVAQVFVDGGFGAAYVQKKEVTAYDSDTVFYSNLLISLAIYLVFWISAPAIAGFYEQPVLIELTRVMALVIIINAFNLIQMAQIMRDVDFKRKTKVTLIATILSGVAGIASAYAGFGVWSLVIQQIANRILTTCGLWVTSKWRPGLKFSTQSFKSLFSFGFWILAAGLIRTIFDNIYILVIGKFFPAAQLGFYEKAKRFKQIASEEVSGAVGAVAFPVLSQLQHDKPRLKQAVRKLLIHTLVFVAPLLVLLIIIAEPFVILILTEKWAPMVPYMQLLCVAGILYPIHAVNVQILKSQGKSNLNFRLAVIKNCFRVVNIVIMYRLGVVFIIIGEIICSILSLIINTYYTKRLLYYGMMEQLNDIRLILFSAAISGLAGYIVIYYIENMYLKLLIGSLLTAAIYVALQYIFNKNLFFQIIRLKENFIR